MKELDKTKPVQLRDGRQVRNVCWDFLFADGTTRIAAIVRDKSCDYQVQWDNNGRYYHFSDTMSETDLINVPERIQGWINVYGEGAIVQFHETKEMADKYASKQGRIACIKINYTVGEGLE